jgi:hypothetical protein
VDGTYNDALRHLDAVRRLNVHYRTPFREKSNKSTKRRFDRLWI